MLASLAALASLALAPTSAAPMPVQSSVEGPAASSAAGPARASAAAPASLWASAAAPASLLASAAAPVKAEEAVAAAALSSPAATAPSSREGARAALTVDGRAGLFGWGIGIDGPVVGVATGYGSSSRPGLGYNLGGGLSWELVPEWLVRLHVMGGRFYRGRATLGYGLDGAMRTRQDADWLGIEAGLGATRLWRGVLPGLEPYVGADVALTYMGYSYHLNEQVSDRLGDPSAETTSGIACGVERRCANDIYDGLSLGVGGGLRAGLRMPMLSWLATETELSASYYHVRDERVTNTLTSLDVHAMPENVMLVRATFSVRVGL